MMNYKLFEEYILLQALLKEVGIIQSGGAIKSFLQEEIVLFNGEKEDRRRKKIRIGDEISLPNQGITITMVTPSPEEILAYEEEKAEKERVAALVKEMNKGLKKAKPDPKKQEKASRAKKAPIRFPGT